MRRFPDAEGREWVAGIHRSSGLDFKGRYALVLTPAAGASAESIVLNEVRWNSERAARKTLASMSEFELHRRLRSAQGRGPVSHQAVTPP